jgi:hypothetical protein
MDDLGVDILLHLFEVLEDLPGPCNMDQSIFLIASAGSIIELVPQLSGRWCFWRISSCCAAKVCRSKAYPGGGCIRPVLAIQGSVCHSGHEILHLFKILKSYFLDLVLGVEGSNEAVSLETTTYIGHAHIKAHRVPVVSGYVVPGVAFAVLNGSPAYTQYLGSI